MADPDQICPVCRRPGVPVTVSPASDRYYVSCPRCGRFQIVQSALPAFLDEAEHAGESGDPRLGPFDGRRRANASAWVAQNPGVVLTSLDSPRLAAVAPPPVLERADGLLAEMGKRSQFIGQQLTLQPDEWLACTWSLNTDELWALANHLAETGWIEVHVVQPSGRTVALVKPLGWARLEEIKRQGRRGMQGFVAMWFDPSMTQTYEGALLPAIRGAGYSPHRVDRREYLGKVDDEIVGQIRQSRFVVADFTGHRHGVYWEAGFAEGLGLPVFFTCRKTDMSGLHFDIRQYNCIDWADEADLLKRLRDRILAVLGNGPLPTADSSEPN